MRILALAGAAIMKIQIKKEKWRGNPPGAGTGYGLYVNGKNDIWSSWKFSQSTIASWLGEWLLDECMRNGSFIGHGMLEKPFKYSGYAGKKSRCIGQKWGCFCKLPKWHKGLHQCRYVARLEGLKPAPCYARWRKNERGHQAKGSGWVWPRCWCGAKHKKV